MNIMPQNSWRFLTVAILYLSVFCLNGCSSSGGSTSSEDATEKEGCKKPDSYSKQNLDDFLGGSYRMCLSLSNANDILRKTNTILHHPRGPIGWAEDEFNKESNKIQKNPLELLSFTTSGFIPEIDKLIIELEDAIAQVPKIATSAPGALTDAQSLGFMKMKDAVSDVNNAKANLNKAGEEFPRVIAGLKQAYAGILQLMSRIQKGEPLNVPMMASTETGTDASSPGAGFAAKDSLATPSLAGAVEMKGPDAQVHKEAFQEKPTEINKAPDQVTGPQIAQYGAVVALAGRNDLQAYIARMQELLDSDRGTDSTSNSYYWIGLCRYSMHDYNSAVEQFKEVLRLPVSQKNNTAIEWFESAKQKYESKDYQGAVREYTKAIDMNPRYAEAYNNRGAANLALEQKSKAMADFMRAIELRYPVDLKLLDLCH